MNYMVEIIDIIFVLKISFVNKNHYIVAFPPKTVNQPILSHLFCDLWKLTSYAI